MLSITVDIKNKVRCCYKVHDSHDVFEHDVFDTSKNNSLINIDSHDHVDSHDVFDTSKNNSFVI